MLTKYGYGTIGIVMILVFIIISLSFFINNGIFKYSALAVGIVILIFTINFFRDPDRTPPKRDDAVISPADGKVLIVKKINATKFVDGEAWQISIFMSPLNVHVNRIPIDGKVEYLKYIEGEYLVAYHDKADERNERSEIGISSKHGKVFFTQVAGAVARRIVYDIDIGQNVKMGERFGMIKFGSRVDVVVNSNWKPMVSEGDVVTAGETILYEIDK